MAYVFPVPFISVQIHQNIHKLWQQRVTSRLPSHFLATTHNTSGKDNDYWEKESKEGSAWEEEDPLDSSQRFLVSLTSPILSADRKLE
jgi:hypothetical protein